MENPYELPASLPGARPVHRDEAPVAETAAAETTAPPRARRGRKRRVVFWSVIAGVTLVLWGAGLALLASYLGGFRYVPAAQAEFRIAGGGGDPAGSKDVKALEKKLAGILPRGPFIVVDTVEQRLQVRSGDEILRDGLCSAGTSAKLTDPRNGKEYIFDTPKGIRRVRGKKVDPVWIKPDWAIIEEGGDPAKTPWNDRVDADTLGKYALELGDGYMIHGTLYQRYLGRPVTHGCIRLGDADLEYVYQTIPVGTAVFIY